MTHQWYSSCKYRSISAVFALFSGRSTAGVDLLPFTGLRAIGEVFQTPAVQAVVPLIVPREELVRANAWDQFWQSGALMLGPVLGPSCMRRYRSR